MLGPASMQLVDSRLIAVWAQQSQYVKYSVESNHHDSFAFMRYLWPATLDTFLHHWPSFGRSHRLDDLATQIVTLHHQASHKATSTSYCNIKSISFNMAHLIAGTPQLYNSVYCPCNGQNSYQMNVLSITACIFNTFVGIKFVYRRVKVFTYCSQQVADRCVYGTLVSGALFLGWICGFPNSTCVPSSIYRHDSPGREGCLVWSQEPDGLGHFVHVTNTTKWVHRRDKLPKLKEKGGMVIYHIIPFKSDPLAGSCRVFRAQIALKKRKK